MPLEFTTETVISAKVKDNDFVPVVNDMPVIGTGEGQVAPGSEEAAKGARGFIVDGPPNLRGDDANTALNRLLRDLSSACDARTGGPVSPMKSYEMLQDKDAKGKPTGAVRTKVVFYIVPKRTRSKSAVESTPNTVPTA